MDRSIPSERIYDLEVGFRDLEFSRMPQVRYSSRGTAFTTWIPVGMPRIPQKLLDCVCYLYSDENSARDGKEFGGTGFIVSVSSAVPGFSHNYIVSNWHVAVSGGCSVVRINTVDGPPDIFSFGPEEWEFDPRYDLAIAPIPLKHGKHKYAAVNLTGSLTKEDIEAKGIGVGEDIFMIGRFVDHDGDLVNQPSVRMGNISVMPTSIKQPNGRMADVFCLDLHSRSGYSGSPVFIYRTPVFNLEDKNEGEFRIMPAGTSMLCLLGIHFGQFPEIWELIDESPTYAEAKRKLGKEGKYIKGLSGMTCVLPVWNIMEVLDMPKLKADRKNAAEFVSKLHKITRGVPTAEAETAIAVDAAIRNPDHKEDFTSLLGAASKAKPPTS